jgi:hypothetical protein
MKIEHFPYEGVNYHFEPPLDVADDFVPESMPHLLSRVVIDRGRKLLPELTGVLDTTYQRDFESILADPGLSTIRSIGSIVGRSYKVTISEANG